MNIKKMLLVILLTISCSSSQAAQESPGILSHILVKTALLSIASGGLVGTCAHMYNKYFVKRKRHKLDPIKEALKAAAFVAFMTIVFDNIQPNNLQDNKENNPVEKTKKEQQKTQDSSSSSSSNNSGERSLQGGSSSPQDKEKGQQGKLGEEGDETQNDSFSLNGSSFEEKPKPPPLPPRPKASQQGGFSSQGAEANEEFTEEEFNLPEPTSLPTTTVSNKGESSEKNPGSPSPPRDRRPESSSSSSKPILLEQIKSRRNGLKKDEKNTKEDNNVDGNFLVEEENRDSQKQGKPTGDLPFNIAMVAAKKENGSGSSNNSASGGCSDRDWSAVENDQNQEDKKRIAAEAKAALQKQAEKKEEEQRKEEEREQNRLKAEAARLALTPEEIAAKEEEERQQSEEAEKKQDIVLANLQRVQGSSLDKQNDSSFFGSIVGPPLEGEGSSSSGNGSDFSSGVAVSKARAGNEQPESPSAEGLLGNITIVDDYSPEDNTKE